MVNVEICIGSACYVKGSSQVVNDLNALIKEKGWEDKIAVKGSFCMKACQNHIGLGIRINGRQIEGVTAQNAREILDRELSAALA
ncbi:MAG: (2Fe-2S) ferredoxin domain-containing protein [Solobacterium sp.]|jgi:NADH-quinone oxidoreductase subunit G|nr:(2Fe-2S) ferredoxin domain-containing protein [Solobacterium sp.]MBQ1439176.1 (2Fe-2S) ferredoxin domain-containing protein [Solobacterium sp.]MBQ8068307.1 (2Fe-2S) ferredoxin domain-containing protein [Solobacterium sp.]